MSTENKTQRQCKACGEMHDLKYVRYSNAHLHLFYKCPKTRQTFMVKYIAGLPIPEVATKKLTKILNDQKTPNLL